MKQTLTERLKREALRLVSTKSALPVSNRLAFLQWLDAGHAASMNNLKRLSGARSGTSNVLERVKSLLSFSHRPEPERAMLMTLPPYLEPALAVQAQRRGLMPEALVLEVLLRNLLPVAHPVPADEWECRLFDAAIDCGVSVPDAALSSEGLYE